jgi:hypothetical protein
VLADQFPADEIAVGRLADRLAADPCKAEQDLVDDLEFGLVEYGDVRSALRDIAGWRNGPRKRFGSWRSPLT